MSLAVRLPDEPNADVLRELHLALGRLATPEAVQALRAAASPGRGLLSRKPVANRLGAIEGLGLAGGPAAAGALQELLSDDDVSVREAAARALGRG
jgi:HEAT repeat protein